MSNLNLKDELQQALNKCSAENESDTPDFLLASYLLDCLAAYDKVTQAREKWYDGRRGIKASSANYLS